MGALCTSAIFINLKLFPNKELAGAVFKLKLKTLSCEENFYLPSSYTCMKTFSFLWRINKYKVCF